MKLEIEPKNKNLGQYFTPKIVADFMVTLITKQKYAKVLEPCAGEGVFLESLWKAGFKNIVAYEIDKTLQNKSSIPIEYRDFLKVPPKEEFDVIIGNPPYVRWRNIPKEWREMFKKNPYWNKIINGLSDLTYAFIYHSVNMLKNKGELIFITPIFWTETVHGKRLREYLIRQGDIDILINLNEMKIFPGVSSTIIIFRYIKEKKNRPVKVVKIHTKERIHIKHLKNVKELIERLTNKDVKHIRKGIYEAYIHEQFKDGESWNTLPPNNSNLLIKLELKNPSAVVPLGELAEIGNGMVSGLDKAFSLKDTNLSKLTPDEEKRIIWVYKARTLNKIAPSKPPIPYLYANDIKDEDEFKQRCPNFYRHLLPFKEKLLNRYNYCREIPWWHWVFPRNKHLFEKYHEKIFVPSKERYDSRGYFRFTYIKDSKEKVYYATQDVTGIFVKSSVKEETKYIVGLLNSTIYQDYILHKGFTRGGVYDFSEQPLAKIPIIRINFTNDREKEIYNQIVKIVEEIIKTGRQDTDRLNKLVEKLIEIKLRSGL